VRTKPSHLDLWVGAKIIDELIGKGKILLIIFFLLKKNLRIMS
jgi:pyridoxine 5-phosphate synthase